MSQPKSVEFVPTSDEDDSEVSDIEEQQKKKKKQQKEKKKNVEKKSKEKRVCHKYSLKKSFLLIFNHCITV